MKKIILSFMTCAIAVTGVKAQIAKGNLFMGTGLGTTTYNFGTYNYNYSDGNVKTQDQKNYSLNLSPQIGVFLSDHLIFGGMLDLAYSNDKEDFTNTTDNFLINNSTTDATTFSVGPFLRYYFFDSQPTKTLFFVQADAGLGTGGGSTNGSTLSTANASTTSSGNTNSMFVFRAGGSLGLTHFIQRNIGLDIGIGYLYNDETYTTTMNTQTTTAGGVLTTTPGTYKAKVPQSGITLSAGFHFFIDDKKQ